MSPFKGPTWNEAVKHRLKEKKDEEELAAKMKEHDYSECYCHALKKPPWGGYSIEEQILYEIKQRRRRGGQGKRQATGTSSYKYLKKDQAAILEEAAGKGILQTTKSVQMFLLPNSGLISRSSEQELFSELIAAQLGHVSISKVDKAHTPSVVAITHQLSTNVFQINAPRKSSQRGSLQDHQQSRPPRARHPLGSFPMPHHRDRPRTMWRCFRVGKTPLSHPRTHETCFPLWRLHCCSHRKKQV